ncbi:unnamed protein product [Linum trigynum]|uniref:Uncharacterized protein n=1 Tax=Linum trigynum TaxID=586398 RepID=A0AAV2FYV7_9ROSI
MPSPPSASSSVGRLLLVVVGHGGEKWICNSAPGLAPSSGFERGRLRQRRCPLLLGVVALSFGVGAGLEEVKEGGSGGVWFWREGVGRGRG